MLLNPAPERVFLLATFSRQVNEVVPKHSKNLYPYPKQYHQWTWCAWWFWLNNSVFPWDTLIFYTFAFFNEYTVPWPWSSLDLVSRSRVLQLTDTALATLKSSVDCYRYNDTRIELLTFYLPAGKITSPVWSSHLGFFPMLACFLIVTKSGNSLFWQMLKHLKYVIMKKSHKE